MEDKEKEVNRRNIHLSDFPYLNGLFSDLREVSDETRNLPSELEQKFLGVKSKGEIINFTSTITGYRETMLFLSWEHIKSDKSMFTLLESSNSLLKTESGYVNSYSVFEENKSKKRVIMRMDRVFGNGMTLNLVIKKKDKDVASLFDVFFSHFVSNCLILQNKKFEFLSTGEVKFIEMKKFKKPILPKETEELIERNISAVLSSKVKKRGILFSGPPGTGKSSYIKYLLSKKDVSMILASVKDVCNSFFTEVYEIAKKIAPTIVVLEDADIYGGNRNNPRLNELMNLLDGVTELEGVVTIATTNNAPELDSALLNRPGRFDEIVDFWYPEEREREKLIKRYLSPKIKKRFNKKEKEQLLDILKNQTPAFIEGVGISCEIEEKDTFEDLIEIIKRKKKMYVFEEDEKEDVTG